MVVLKCILINTYVLFDIPFLDQGPLGLPGRPGDPGEKGDSGKSGQPVSFMTH